MKVQLSLRQIQYNSFLSYINPTGLFLSTAFIFIGGVREYQGKINSAAVWTQTQLCRDLLTHLASWFVCGNNLSDETKLGGRDSTDQEDEEQRVVAGMWTSHLQLRRDIVIGQCIVFTTHFVQGALFILLLLLLVALAVSVVILMRSGHRDTGHYYPKQWMMSSHPGDTMADMWT